MKHSGPISSLAIRNSDLFSGGYDGTVGWFDVEVGRYNCLHSLHKDLVSAIAASDGIVVSGGSYGDVVVARLDHDSRSFDQFRTFDLDAEVEAILDLGDQSFLFGTSAGSIFRAELGGADIEATKWLSLGGTVTAIRRLDEDSVVVSCNDGRLRLIDLDTGEDVVLYESDLPVKNCLVIDESHVVCGGHDGHLVLVDLDGQDRTVAEWPASVRGLATGAGRLIVGVYDGTVWEFMIDDFLAGGRAAGRCLTNDDVKEETWTKGMAISPDGRIFTGSMTGRPIEVDSHRRVRGNIGATVREMDRVYIGTDNGDIYAFEKSTGITKLVGTVGSAIGDLAVGADGSVLAVTWDGSAWSMCSETGATERIDSHGVPAMTVTATKDRNFFGDYLGVVHNSTSNEADCWSIQAMPSSVKAVDAHPEGSALAVAGRYGPLTILSADGEMVCRRELKTRLSNAVAFAPDGSHVATQGANAEIWVFGVDADHELSHDPVARFPYHSKSPKCIRWLDDHRMLSAGYDGGIGLHDLTTGQSRDLAPTEEHIGGIIALEPLDTEVLVAHFDGTTRLVSLSAEGV